MGNSDKEEDEEEREEMAKIKREEVTVEMNTRTLQKVKLEFVQEKDQGEEEEINEKVANGNVGWEEQERQQMTTLLGMNTEQTREELERVKEKEVEERVEEKEEEENE